MHGRGPFEEVMFSHFKSCPLINFVHPLDWSKASSPSKRSYVEVLLESLEHKDADLRLANIRKLLYIIQGTHSYDVPEDLLSYMTT